MSVIPLPLTGGDHKATVRVSPFFLTTERWEWSQCYYFRPFPITEHFSSSLSIAESDCEIENAQDHTLTLRASIDEPRVCQTIGRSAYSRVHSSRCFTGC